MPTTLTGTLTIASPYNGAQPITITREGVTPGEIVEAWIPTNFYITSQDGASLGYQHWDTAGDTQDGKLMQGWRVAGQDGKVTFVFNASLQDEVVHATQANGWVLPAGSYQIKTKLFSDKTNASVEAASFTIGSGEALASIQTAARNKAKGKQK